MTPAVTGARRGASREDTRLADGATWITLADPAGQVAKLMPFAMGVIVVLFFLFMSGLYLDITDPL